MDNLKKGPNIFVNMSEKFKNTYRIKSARLQNYDYGQNGSYFITICTKNREDFFGKIIDGKMKYNKIGIISNNYWQQISEKFSFVKLGEFIIMPNHIHGILKIHKSPLETSIHGVSNKKGFSNKGVSNKKGFSNKGVSNNNTMGRDVDGDGDGDAMNRVYTDRGEDGGRGRDGDADGDAMNRVYTVPAGGVTKNKNPMLYKNISTIIRWFKGRTSFEARKINLDFAWHSRFHDHIIRNEKELERISEYIIYNPKKWKE